VTNRADSEQNELVKERFTRTADAFVRIAVPQRAAEAERLASLVQTSREDVGLDLACGPGTFAIAIAPLSCRMLGVDLTPAFLRRARDRANEQAVANVWFVCGEATALPIRDGSIDFAVCGYSFHHMREPQRALRELARVLGSRGRLGVVDIYAPDGLDPNAVDRIERARDASHFHSFTRMEFREAVERAGFQIHTAEALQRRRLFSDWMQIAGWKPDDPAWRESRRLLEGHLTEDSSGFHPRLLPAKENAEPEIEITQPVLFVGAIKS
jgi:ubiquinone/menaquinone biosynthesis C-methylase UbiE